MLLTSRRSLYLYRILYDPNGSKSQQLIEMRFQKLLSNGIVDIIVGQPTSKNAWLFIEEMPPTITIQEVHTMLRAIARDNDEVDDPIHVKRRARTE